jgi:hypothetical protein
MGVTLDFRMIDHDFVVQRGIPVVNAALAADDASLLMRYILDARFTPNSEAVAFRQGRCDQLRKMSAPQMIIQFEERMLGLVNGEAYSGSALAKLNLDELRALLGTWGWAENSFSVDKVWCELDWFLQPAEGPDGVSLMYPVRPNVGDSGQTLLDRSLKGSQPSPCDSSGMPIIRTCGSQHDDCFGYNPPDVVSSISLALSAVDDQKWSDLVPQRIDQYCKACPEFADDFAGIVAQELDYARMAIEVVRHAYSVASERGLGIACEYSL